MEVLMEKANTIKMHSNKMNSLTFKTLAGTHGMVAVN